MFVHAMQRLLGLLYDWLDSLVDLEHYFTCSGNVQVQASP